MVKLGKDGLKLGAANSAVIATLCIEVTAVRAFIVHLAYEEFCKSKWDNEHDCRDSYVE